MGKLKGLYDSPFFQFIQVSFFYKFPKTTRCPVVVLNSLLPTDILVVIVHAELY
jgi:hypothetical protein